METIFPLPPPSKSPVAGDQKAIFKAIKIPIRQTISFRGRLPNTIHHGKSPVERRGWGGFRMAISAQHRDSSQFGFPQIEDNKIK